MTRKFSRFIIWVLIIFQGVSLALVLGILYGILSSTMTAKFHNEIKAQKVEVNAALHDRIDRLNTRLQELSLNNTVRVSLMLGVENQLVELMLKQYPRSDGAFYCIQEGQPARFFPELPPELTPLSSHMKRLAVEKHPRTIMFPMPGGHRFSVLLSAPIMRKTDRLGTAFVCYDLSKDNQFWARFRAMGRARLLIQSGQELVDLHTGWAVPIFGKTSLSANSGIADIQRELLPDHVLVPLKDFRGIFYAHSSLPLQQQKRNLILILTGLCAAIFLLTLLVAFLIARRVSNPLRNLADQAQAIARAPTGRFLSPEGIRHIEFRKLTQAFNQVLASLLKAQKALEKRAQKELAASEERYRRTLEAAPDAITLTTLKEGRYLQVNEAFCKMTGYSAEETIGKTVAALDVFVDPADRDTLVKALRAQGEVNGLEIRYRRKDRTLFDTLLSARQIQFDGEECLIAVTTEITDLKKTQRDKARLEKKLQQAQKMEAIGTLAGGVAHDLNNILSGIVSYPELLLLDLPPDSPMRKPILTIQKSGERAAAIVEDLLTLARRGVAITEVVNINEVITEYLNSPEYGKLKSLHAGMEVKTTLEPDLLNIYGSSLHLSKTVMNLICNAAEAMPEGGTIMLSTQNRYIDRPIQGYEDVNEGDYVVLTVEDTGMGIPMKDMERIFEPFYTKKNMGRSGTGLGMSVVWGTVKDHQGYIDLQSVEDEGTLFRLYFPATRDALVQKEALLPPEAYAGKRGSVLVVDDVAQQREIACSMLRKLGYEVASAPSGEEAVDYVKSHPVDILLLDMIMDPGMDGLDTYRSILNIHPGQKAIIASGFSETDRVKAAQHLGAGTYIKKPYVLEKLGLAIKNELER